MDFLTLCQRVRQESGIADSGPSAVTNQTGDMQRIVDWVNEAYMRIQSYRNDWKWLWTTDTISVTQGTAVYALPATVENLIADTVYLDGNKIAPLTYDDYRDQYPTLITGVPTAFTIRPDGQIALNASPDAAYTLSFEGYTKPAYFAAGTDVPAFDERFHMVIAWNALKEYALFDEANELFQKANVNYEQLLAELSADSLPEMLTPESIA